MALVCGQQIAKKVEALPLCRGHTLLMCAVGNSCIPMVHELSDPDNCGIWDVKSKAHRAAAAALLFAKDSSGFTAAHHAARQDESKLLSWLLNSMCKLHDSMEKLPTDSQTHMWRPPSKGNTLVELLEALLRMQPEAGHPSLLSLVALSPALTETVAEVMKKWGSTASIQNLVRHAHSHAESLWDPPLLHAATLGDIKGVRHICKLLGGKSAETVACTGRAGETALHRAAVCEHEHLFDELWSYPFLAKRATEAAPAGWTREERTALEQRWQAAALVNAIFSSDSATAEQLLSWGALVCQLLLALSQLVLLPPVAFCS
jgi:ankyrin repeat protein